MRKLYHLPIKILDLFFIYPRTILLLEFKLRLSPKISANFTVFFDVDLLGRNAR
jgi:hypothetical protein